MAGQAKAPDKMRLVFEAAVKEVRPNVGTGKLLVTLEVEQPQSQKKPEVPYQWSKGYGAGAVWKARPADLVRKDKETDAAYGKRTAETTTEQAGYDRAKERHEAELVRWSVQVRAQSARLMSYAMLGGVAMVLGSTKVMVSLEPANQDLLPGFGALLLPETVEASE